MSDPKIYTPADWGAFSNPEGRGVPLSLPLAMVIMHTFAGASFAGKSVSQVMVYLRAIERFHVNERRFASIGYNFMVDEAGNIYKGRGWKRSGAHTQGYNRKSFGIALIGNGDKNPATEEQIRSVQWLLAEGIALGHLTADFSLHGHREFANKSCPGNLIYPLVEDGTFRPPLIAIDPTPSQPMVTGYGSPGETVENFIMNCYLVYLGRFATEENVKFWAANFPDRADIEREISNSPEANSRKDNAIWLNFLLDRTVPKIDLDRGAVIIDLNDYRLSRLDVVRAVKTIVILGDTLATESTSEVAPGVIQNTIDEISRRLNDG